MADFGICCDGPLETSRRTNGATPVSEEDFHAPANTKERSANKHKARPLTGRRPGGLHPPNCRESAVICFILFFVNRSLREECTSFPSSWCRDSPGNDPRHKLRWAIQSGIACLVSVVPRGPDAKGSHRQGPALKAVSRTPTAT